MCEIICADGLIDPFESNFIRRLSGLLYVSDKESGIIKKQVMKEIEKVKKGDFSDDYLNSIKQPMSKGTWDMAIDVAGGEMLAGLIASMKYGGTITSCGIVYHYIRKNFFTII